MEKGKGPIGPWSPIMGPIGPFGKIGHPSSGNGAQNRVSNRDNNSATISTDLFKSRAQKGREYSPWIDLTLRIHFEAVIPESYRTKVRFMSKQTFLG